MARKYKARLKQRDQERCQFYATFPLAFDESESPKAKPRPLPAPRPMQPMVFGGITVPA